MRDLKKAFHFYHEVLGLPVVQIIGQRDRPRLVFLQGIELSPFKPDDEGKGGFSHLGLEVMNIEEACEELEGRGVTMEAPVRDIIFEEEGKAVKVVSFRDPDGNRVELVEWRDI